MSINENPLADKLDNYLQTLTANGHFSGVILCARGDKLILKCGYGLSDRCHGLANTPETVFPIASLTKSFTATAILRLVAQKQIDLNESILFYLPECASQWQAVTPHHLLSHTSGIPDYSALPNFDIAKILPTTHWTLINKVGELPLNFTPDTRWGYTNMGYHLLGALLERISGTTIENFFTNNLFRPLGMRDTSCLHTVSTGRFARGYSRTDDAILPSPLLDLSQSPAAGGIYSTADDLYRWSQGIHTPQLLPLELHRRMHSQQAATNETQFEHYGYGWAMREAFGSQLIAHDGRLPGYKHMLSYLHAHQMTILVLGNYDWIKPGLLAQELATLMLESD